MKRPVLLFSIFILSTLFLAACSDKATNPGDDTQQPVPVNVDAAVEKLIEADQSFSVDIFKEVVASDTAENTFISPLSISVALGMTMNGAKDNTFEEMRQTLAFDNIELQEINEGYKSLIDELTNADPKVEMNIANSVWNDKNFSVKEDFSNRLKEYFYAEARALDFADPSSKDVINSWVSDKTNKKIKTIIDEIPSNMVMYLINAVYFNGNWKYEFDPENTRDQPFSLEDGGSSKVKMMNQKNELPFYISDQVQMIDLPYGDSLFTMTLLMPGDSDTPVDEFIANDFSKENLNDWYRNLEMGEVEVGLPKLELEYKIKLNNVLKVMGMPMAFTPAADLTGINDDPRLFISEVLHKTYLKMDEEGAEAAAVTSVGVAVTSVQPGPPRIIFDRPYIMILREQSSGAILFMGKVKNPVGD